MAKHLVFWNFIKELNEEQRIEAGKKLKEQLEGLKNRIPGLVDVQFIINNKEGSTRDVALICELEKPEDIPAYQAHPLHQSVVPYIKSVLCDRVCFDY